ncbi:OmpA family protein [Alkalihalobacillus sp. LMS39]|uniref:OmpA family protein n=1 Tax=Alkalihalobacillus sp. LMS39 TaxID=2924032 RepID=UPI001FB4F33A|nr:OmpA family protein [Alkalihalobacillus sp. LMS39]UOE93593.1 OmpA family protein [Alkalihalobacillus sp. LMS39]
MASKHKKGHDEEHVDESWLIPYADMLTLLLALFVILFAVSQVDAQKYEEIKVVLSDALGGTGSMEGLGDYEEGLGGGEGTTPEEQTEEEKEQEVQNTATVWDDLELLKERLDSYINEENLNEQLTTEITPDGLMIIIHDEIMFAPGVAVLKPTAKKVVVSLADILAQDPPLHIRISGHTDNVPIHNDSFQSNWDLSAVRALNVMNIFLENDNIKPKQLSIAGYGEYQPIASNDTPEGREKNRRVEVLVLPKTEE